MLASLILTLALVGPTEITFVRHGETQANATGKYSAATLNAFSAKGHAQVSALTRQLLREQRFDKILVSPSLRAMNTILPYLRATRQRAVIWPLLYECCTGKRPAAAHAAKFAWGAKIKLGSLAPFFTLMPGEDRLPVAPGYNEGLAQVDAALKELPRLRVGGRMLLVGHSGQGGQMIHALTGKWKKVDNAKEMTFSLP